MLKYLERISSTPKALVGLIAALSIFVIPLFFPQVNKAAVYTPAALLGGICFAYLLVHSVWPSTKPFSIWLISRVCHLSAIAYQRAKTPRWKLRNPPHKGSLNTTSTAFFDYRFGKAFPGVRTTTWYYDKDAVRRLKVLLDDPLTFQHNDGATIPIWWFCDGNLHIDEFDVLNRRTVLLDSKELRVKCIAAVPSTSYKRRFVYLEAEPMKPCGAYSWTQNEIERFVTEHGYAWEEYGLYKGKRPVTRTEYDDSAALIRGRPVNLAGNLQLRSRYLTPYNLLIAPVGSPINNSQFDRTLRTYMDQILARSTDLTTLERVVAQLPPKWEPDYD